MSEYTIDWILSREDRYRYQMLDRMKMDCNYYLGNGQLYGNHLWAGNAKDQIRYMKTIWNSLPDKPEWLTWEQIEDYEKKMCTESISGFDGEYQFLSNFYPCQISFYGLQFKSVEAAYQAAKCSNPKQREIFCDLSAAAAKHLGRTVELRPDWEQHKVTIRNHLLVHKFHDNPELKEQLVATGVTPLIEANTWHDNFWGDCTCARCASIKGRNMLGKLLMDIRKYYTAICGARHFEFSMKLYINENTLQEDQ